MGWGICIVRGCPHKVKPMQVSGRKSCAQCSQRRRLTGNSAGTSNRRGATKRGRRVQRAEKRAARAQSRLRGTAGGPATTVEQRSAKARSYRGGAQQTSVSIPSLKNKRPSTEDDRLDKQRRGQRMSFSRLRSSSAAGALATTLASSCARQCRACRCRLRSRSPSQFASRSRLGARPYSWQRPCCSRRKPSPSSSWTRSVAVTLTVGWCQGQRWLRQLL